MKDRLVITEVKAAAVFGNARQRRIVLELIDEDRSMAEISRITSTPLNLLSHHLRKLVQLNLVSITRSEARAGMPIKFYRACAREFFVPADYLRRLPGQDLNLRLRESLEQGLTRSVEGVVYDVAHGMPRLRVLRGSSSPIVSSELWLELRMSRRDAEALSSELREVIKKFKNRFDATGRNYIVHAAIAPSE